jgi:hypothetical protein
MAVMTETFNSCRTTQDDPCVRVGNCDIQGGQWDQTVTVDRSDIFATQGWPGLCDMVHVALVQGNCEPAGAQADVTVHLSATTSAWIPSITGLLSCVGTASTAAGAVPDGVNVPGNPLAIMFDGTDITLIWSATCLQSDNDFAVYEGTLGQFSSHSARMCSTGGMISATFSAPAGNAYYLVVPNNGTNEGSYGRDSLSFERTPAATSCMPQELSATCP